MSLFDFHQFFVRWNVNSKFVYTWNTKYWIMDTKSSIIHQWFYQLSNGKLLKVVIPTIDKEKCDGDNCKYDFSKRVSPEMVPSLLGGFQCNLINEYSQNSLKWSEKLKNIFQCSCTGQIHFCLSLKSVSSWDSSFSLPLLLVLYLLVSMHLKCVTMLFHQNIPKECSKP